MEFFKKRHIVEIKGGLGNQFYMYAYADYLKRKGKEVALCFVSKTGNTFDRTKRNIIADIPKKMGFSTLPFVFKLLIFKRFFRNISRKFFVKVFVEPEKEWAVFHPIDTIDIQYYNLHIGYFQSRHYVSDDFRKKLSNAVGELCSNFERYAIQPNDVALHIRRGDFLADTLFHKIETSYYLDALNKLKNKISIGTIFIFSDDFQAIKSEIEEISKIANVILVEGQSVLEDMNTLRLFHNYVLGNSTFAWWGAMLSVAKNPNVYVPKTPWKVNVVNASSYFSEWVQIENI